MKKILSLSDRSISSLSVQKQSSVSDPVGLMHFFCRGLSAPKTSQFAKVGGVLRLDISQVTVE